MYLKKIKNRRKSKVIHMTLLSVYSFMIMSMLSCSKEDEPEVIEQNEVAEVSAKVSGATADKAKLQLGNPVKDYSKPSKEFGGRSHDDASFKRDKNNTLIFKAKGSKNRSELRYLSGFGEGAKKSFEAKVNVVSKKHTGFTVMQLHNDNGSGPALKIEYHGDSKGNGYFKADYRKKNGASNSTKRLKDGTSGKFKISFDKRKVKIHVDGKEKHSFTVDKGGWKGNFYWKTGAYNQKSGSSESKISAIKW